MTKPRWFRFSLRTLFVLVTIVAMPLCWLTWQYRLVYERNEFRRMVGVKGGFIVVEADAAPVSFVRASLGDYATGAIFLPESSTPDELQRARSLFPEASVGRLHDDISAFE